MSMNASVPQQLSAYCSKHYLSFRRVSTSVATPWVFSQDLGFFDPILGSLVFSSGSWVFSRLFFKTPWVFSHFTEKYIYLIVIVISRFLKRYSKAKRTRAPAYSRALHQIRGVVQYSPW